MSRYWFPQLIVPVAAALLLGLPACTTSRPYRTALNKTAMHCADSLKTKSDTCTSLTPELTEEYELYFVEFDDQGWLHPAKDPDRGEAAGQLDYLMKKLQEKVRNSVGKPKISIVLYVHGWKHNAQYDDTNVQEFRHLLQATYMVERAASPTPREVVGIYVGWRGRSLNVPDPLLNLTFWARKSAALRVAQGSVRELFARLTGFQRYYNEQDTECRPTLTAERPPCGVRMILIGHSFGAWILYSAIEEALITALSAQNDIYPLGTETNSEQHVVGRFADMVVLVNPAFEGSRYEPLHRAALNRKYDHYQAPIFVSVTSTADLATRYAFPIGRLTSTLLQRPTTSSAEGEAIGHTLGHIDRYITHELTKSETTTPECADWKDWTNLPEAERLAQLRMNIPAEKANEAAFFRPYEHGSTRTVYLPEGWKRTFCGGAVLTHLADHEAGPFPNSPVWNVRADASIINSHNDIDRVIFSSFIRQLYHDVLLYRELK